MRRRWDLRAEEGQRQAVFSCDHSDSYVAQVLAPARAYATGIPVEDLLMSGVTSGTVPAPDWSGIPAAPGPAPPRDTGPSAGVRPPRSTTSGGSAGGRGTTGGTRARAGDPDRADRPGPEAACGARARGAPPEVDTGGLVPGVTCGIPLAPLRPEN